ncbi:hypothetical protein PtB15_18B388 [Puccinia triticina]|nr:hypothetical protein PtB15_18B388 [Puccinia triticina]
MIGRPVGEALTARKPASSAPQIVKFSFAILALICQFWKSRGVRLGQNLPLANQTPPAHLLIVRLVLVYAWINRPHVPTQQGRRISTDTSIGLNYPHQGTGWRGNEVEDKALCKPQKCLKMLNSQQIPTLF